MRASMFIPCLLVIIPLYDGNVRVAMSGMYRLMPGLKP